HIKGSQGDVGLRTSNGPLKVDGVKGSIDVHTINGKIEIASSDGAVKARTSNGSIHFKGKVADGEHSFQTSNGGIDLILPSDAQFRIDAETSNSSIDTDFSIQGDDRVSNRKHLRGSVGANPAATITAHTSNGRIKITHE